MRYNKLVRDRIPEIIENTGKRAVFRVLSDDAEYLEYLERKLDEEVAEFHESKSVEEIADILAVVITLSRAMGIHDEELCLECLSKRDKRGGFDKRICLEEVLDLKLSEWEDVNPCKCGGRPQIVKIIPKRPNCFVRCTNCDMETRTYYRRDAARRAWERLMEQ